MFTNKQIFFKLNGFYSEKAYFKYNRFPIFCQDLEFWVVYLFSKAFFFGNGWKNIQGEYVRP